MLTSHALAPDWELLADPTAEREPPARLKCSVPLTTPSSLPRSQAPPANIYLRAGEAQRMRETEVRAQVEDAAAHIHTLVSNLIQNGTDPQHIMLVGHGQVSPSLCLRARYATSGSNLLYASTRPRMSSPSVQCRCHTGSQVPLLATCLVASYALKLHNP